MAHNEPMRVSDLKCKNIVFILHYTQDSLNDFIIIIITTNSCLDRYYKHYIADKRHPQKRALGFRFLMNYLAKATCFLFRFNFLINATSL